VGGVGEVQYPSALFSDQLRTAEVHGGRGVEPDARVAVVVVVPGEEATTVVVGVFEGPEGLGESGRYLRVRKWLSG
jgi:hypothetical protein